MTALFEAVSIALVGEAVGRQGGAETTVAEVLRALASLGWDGAAIAAHVDQVRAEGGRWPHPVPLEYRAALGAARLSSAVTSARQQLGLLGAATAPAPARPLNADERRLLADAPPHHCN